MAKKKPKPFRATKAVKSAAREVLGTPPPAHVLPDEKKKRQARQKHKKTLAQLLVEP